MKTSIAAKIFSLAVVLVTIMIALVAFLLVQVRALNRTLAHFSQTYQPLDEALMGLNEAGLRRRIAFERMIAALSAGADREHALADASANYDKYTRLVGERTAESGQLLDTAVHDAEFTRQFERIRAQLGQMSSTYAIVDKRQKEYLALVKAGDNARALPLLSIMDEMQVNLQNLRRDTHDTIRGVILLAAEQSAKQHTRVLWLSIAATFVSVAIGLSLAALITSRLVRPVLSLVTGIGQVRKGDLTIELPIQSTDEVGAVTQAFNYFIGELRSKEELRSTFGKYIDPRILTRIMRDPAAQEAGPERQEMTVSFSDLVGFTGIGEHLTPANLVNFINRHFTLQAGAIQAHDGVIDKFLGDSVMAFWGPPFTDKTDAAVQSCRAALDEIRAVETLRQELPDLTGLRRNLPDIDLRIGISTGNVVVGNIGSQTTRSFTVMGDTVNVASRLEHLNRVYGTRILLCETTLARAGGAILVREIDAVVAMGKTESTRIFELLALANGAPPALADLAAHFTRALQAFRKREWDAAKAAFEQCLTLRPDDPPSRLFLDRIATYRETPPPATWDGSWQMQEK